MVLHIFQSTLPSQGATRQDPALHPDSDISIHAPLTGSDGSRNRRIKCHVISIHAPLTGSDSEAAKGRERFDRFQSTLPSQGATGHYHVRCMPASYFNPRSPHRERQDTIMCDVCPPLISIHAPLTGSDFAFIVKRFIGFRFQSTLPSQGATRRVYS